MTGLTGRFADLDFRALAPALLTAACAFAALFLFIDRLERIAQAKRISGNDMVWTANKGMELRLSGLEPGPLVGVETSPGSRLTVRTQQGALTKDGPPKPLVWLTLPQKGGDNKAKVEVSVLDKGGTVRLSRAGEQVAPQLLIRAEDADLRVDSGVTVGDELNVPETQISFGKEPLQPTGPGFTFFVPKGSFVAIEFPALPDGTPSGVVTTLGSVREEQQDTVLPLREVGIYGEGGNSPDQAVCAANHEYAWGVFTKSALFPVPRGSDCRPGQMTGRGFSIGPDFVAVSLAGYAWHMQEGRPTESFYSMAAQNPVLSLFIHWALPAAFAWILGRIVWRRRSPAREEEGQEHPAEPKPVEAKAEAKHTP